MRIFNYFSNNNIGTFNKLGDTNLYMKGGDLYELKRFLNLFTTYKYLSFNIITIRSFNIKENT